VSKRVLDASAVLAVVQEESGKERVIQAMADGSCISAINLCEVVGKLLDGGFSEEVISASIEELELEVVSFDKDQAITAGLLRATTRQIGLSIADRACLALASATGLPTLTGDRAWTQLDVGVEVELFR
jgi:ribonuclease VapC